MVNHDSIVTRFWQGFEAFIVVVDIIGLECSLRDGVMMEPVERSRYLGKDTLVPVGAVLTIIIVLIGGILWLTEIRSIAAQNQDEISDIKDSLRVINSVDQRLSRMEGKLEIIYDSVKENKQ